jgi:hypothetical protein
VTLSAQQTEDALEHLWAEYRRLVMRPAPLDEPKEVTAHHAACRSVLSHVEHLLKAARPPSAEAPPDLTTLIELASRALDSPSDPPADHRGTEAPDAEDQA